MGNEQSSLAGIDIENKSVEVSDFWSHHSATLLNSETVTNLTVLIGEVFVDGPLWKTQTPLEKCSKNLMIYRHPCIVKYISSWQKNSRFYLAIEEVRPLSQVLSSQNSLQICVGLHSILKALCFLHEKASVSHNNVCIASVYVNKTGDWKLGGAEYLCRFTDLKTDYLKKSESHRYGKAVDSDEGNHLQKTTRKDFIDVYAYGVLVCEVLKNKTDDQIPSLNDFRELCKNSLQNINVAVRPTLASLLDHEFFNHDFILIHSSLVELPLKSDEEKTLFFQDLVERLRAFQEDTVASQLGSLLLSRMVLLNKTAQEELLPYILRPRDDSDEDSDKLFSLETFQAYISPVLLEIFCVRDAQIRLLLLQFFNSFSACFTKENLQTRILPELLLGVKDTNDVLVAATLRTLADLVPLLGATTVIGGKRGRLFNDGRPIVHPRRGRKNVRLRLDSVASIPQRQNPIVDASNEMMELPERPQPDGEEEETTEDGEQTAEEDLDNWEDWEVNGATAETLPAEAPVETAPVQETTTPLAASEETRDLRKKSLPDIALLDIKNQTGLGGGDEFDFFRDMEPIIERASKHLITPEASMNSLINSKLSFKASDHVNEAGWGDEEWD